MQNAESQSGARTDPARHAGGSRVSAGKGISGAVAGRDDFHVVPNRAFGFYGGRGYGTTWKSSLPELRILFLRWLRLVSSAYAQRRRHPPRDRSPDSGSRRTYLPRSTEYLLRYRQRQGCRALDANTTVQDSLAEIWRAEATAWLVGYYLVMPDHMHFFCAPHDLHFGIDQWVEYWKSRFSRRHLGQSWPWQRKSFHHRLRNRIAYEEKLIYVQENPLRKQLVARPEEWPYQGRIHDLRWTAD